MRAGQLDRTITLQSFTSTVDEYGTPVETWIDAAAVRAQLLQASTEEYLRGYGEVDGLAVIFRIRWRDGITADQRVVYEGKILNIREVKEIGRRRGLELRCDEVPA